MVNCTTKSGTHPKGGDRTCPLCGPRNYKERASAALEKLGVQGFETETVNEDFDVEIDSISSEEAKFYQPNDFLSGSGVTVSNIDWDTDATH